MAAGTNKAHACSVPIYIKRSAGVWLIEDPITVKSFLGLSGNTSRVLSPTWRRRILRAGVRAATVGLVWYLAGCTASLTIQSIYAQQPNLTVRGSTKITISASSLPGQTIHYYVTAQRGRIFQDTSTDNTVIYYAPFTSRAPDSTGNMTSGDTLTIRVSDDTATRYATQTLNLTGDTVVLQEASANCSNDSSVDCNGTLYAGTVDSYGSNVSDLHPLGDSTGTALQGAQPTISPDGRRIAYVYYAGNGTSAIYTVDSAGQTVNLTGSNPSDGFNVDPTWAPFGDQVAFASDRANPGVFDIYRTPADEQDGSPTRVTTNSQISVRYPDWNPTGSHSNLLAVSAQAVLGPQSNLVQSQDWNVFLLDLNTGQFRQQLSNLSDSGTTGPDFALEPRWDPTGQMVAYTQRGPAPGQASAANAARFQRIIVQCANSSPGSGVLLNPTEQSGTTLAESNPMWDPENGTQIAYLRYQVDQQGNPETPSFYAGTPPEACGNAQSGVTGQGPRQWGYMSQSVAALHMLSTSRMPVGGTEVDWR